MDIYWLTFRLPVFGRVKTLISERVADLPEPWKSHALLRLNLESLSAGLTFLVLGMLPAGKIACSAWLSIPDPRLFQSPQAWAFLQHIFVEAAHRRKGLGSELLLRACSYASKFSIGGVLLAASDSGIRDNFYRNQGFRQFKEDRWLMLYEFKRRSPEPRMRNREVQESPILRAVSFHDLATVQSLRAQQHWYIAPNEVFSVEPEECEEDFSNHFVNSEDGHGIDHFFVKSQLSEVQFTSLSSSLLKKSETEAEKIS